MSVFNSFKPTNRRWNKGQIYQDQKTGNYYHKDGMHGEIEAYNRRGKHIGVLTPKSIQKGYLSKKDPYLGGIRVK
ncbi:colicin E3/pyocin S6 family cytotoxin [Paenibacillus amylolyticus]|uniref:colicin E3/pyocin S6 family cytotoxin n=1 Tax=Paenibacillus amylolyticus TaxID=1451 RepID=UPI003D9C3AE1